MGKSPAVASAAVRLGRRFGQVFGCSPSWWSWPVEPPAGTSVPAEPGPPRGLPPHASVELCSSKKQKSSEGTTTATIPESTQHQQLSQSTKAAQCAWPCGVAASPQPHSHVVDPGVLFRGPPLQGRQRDRAPPTHRIPLHCFVQHRARGGGGGLPTSSPAGHGKGPGDHREGTWGRAERGEVRCSHHYWQPEPVVSEGPVSCTMWGIRMRA